MKEYILLILAIILIVYISTKNVWGALVILILLIITQYNSLHQAWIQVKEREAFENKIIVK